MRRLLPLAAWLWCALAFAGNSTGITPGHSSVNSMGINRGVASPVVFSFTAPAAGSYASLTPSAGGAISCSRASTGTYLDGTGTRQTAAANTCRVENSGLKIEGPSTNYLLNSNSPVTQTTASLGTGSYTGWVEGTGSLAFTAGTAVATGLPCTATTGTANDCHFSITTAGTIVATVTGSLTAEQLEPLPVRSSYIPTTGTAASRSLDSVSATIAAVGPVFSASVSANTDSTDTSTYRFMLALGGAYGTANSASLYRTQSGGSLSFDIYDGTPTLRQYVTGTAPTYVAHKFWASVTGGVQALQVDAVAPAASYGGSGTALASGMTTIWLGGQGGNAPYAFFGNISAACVAKTATGCTP